MRHFNSIYFDVLTLDEWALEQEGDAESTLLSERGDGASVTLRLRRPSCDSDPEQIDGNDPSYYDDEGARVWDFEGATPDEARAKAAAWVREQKP